MEVTESDPDRPVIVICHKVADIALPDRAARRETCIGCGAPVWVALASIAAVAKARRRTFAAICIPCFRPHADKARTVITSNAERRGASGEKARALGVLAGTPVINVDEVNRA